MKFCSTRSGETVDAATAIMNGLAPDGGLYVPEYFPQRYEILRNTPTISYQQLAYELISCYFTDFSKEELRKAIAEAYTGRFSVAVKNDFLELYHGPTSAFKDAALLFLPQIMKCAKAALGLKDEVVILTATSGDTGKAALEGFKNVEGFKVLVYYPKNGVSTLQERQMLSSEGSNVSVVGIRGNFDDAQTGVKAIFSDHILTASLKKKGVRLSSANSINIGRLIPQIVYYFYSYFQLVNEGQIALDDPINVCVPTGNFGNILAGFYAQQMGLPIAKLLCASNENKVLTDFFETGTYDRYRVLILTESPSMDILVSSNLERFLYEKNGRDAKKTHTWMENLSVYGGYTITESPPVAPDSFYGNFAKAAEVHEAIRNIYDKRHYLIDPHTAVAQVVKEKYQRETGDTTPTLVVSTASPFKFPRVMCQALSIDTSGQNDFECLKRLEKVTGLKAPQNLTSLEYARVYYNQVVEKENLRSALEKII